MGTRRDFFSKTGSDQRSSADFGLALIQNEIDPVNFSSSRLRPVGPRKSPPRHLFAAGRCASWEPDPESNTFDWPNVMLCQGFARNLYFIHLQKGNNRIRLF